MTIFPTVCWVKNDYYCIGIILKIHTRKKSLTRLIMFMSFVLVRTLINLSHIFPTTVKSDSRKWPWKIFTIFILFYFASTRLLFFSGFENLLEIFGRPECTLDPQWVGTNEKSAMFIFAVIKSCIPGQWIKKRKRSKCVWREKFKYTGIHEKCRENPFILTNFFVNSNWHFVLNISKNV